MDKNQEGPSIFEPGKPEKVTKGNSNLTSFVINYPNACPKCENSIILPCIPVGEETLLDRGITYFQCTSQECNHQWAAKLTKTDENHHMFLVFAPNMPMGLIILSGAGKQAVMAEVMYRMHKEYGEEAMCLIIPVEDLIKNAKEWVKFFKETEKFMVPPQGGLEPDSKLIKEDQGLGIKPGIMSALEEGKIASELGVQKGEVKIIEKNRKDENKPKDV